jgi:ABC-2 type transporter
MYSVLPYYFSKFLIDIPTIAITPMIFSLIVYFKIGLTVTASQFFSFYLTLLLMSENASSLGYFTSSLFDNEENATGLVPIIILPFVVFGGQFSNSGNYQAWISWFQYVSPIRYGYEALIRNEFDHRNYNTTLILQSLSRNYTLPILNAVANSKELLQNPNFNITDWKIVQMPEINPKDVLNFDVGLWKCLLLLAVISIAMRIASFIILKLLVRKFQ